MKVAICLFFTLTFATRIFATNDSLKTSKKITSEFIISFSSICCGIDHKKENELLFFLQDYPNVSYNTFIWGEEGEIDYCFSLGKLTEKERKIFIKRAKKMMGNSRMITIYENLSCPR